MKTWSAKKIVQKSKYNFLNLNLLNKFFQINDGIVKLKKVKFAYPSRPNNFVANNLDIQVLKGKTVALVGPSGGGKSTIITLLQCFYQANSGSLVIQ